MVANTNLISILFSLIATVSTDIIEDYCWRDYNGFIPSDSYKAGIDRDGNPIYLGQVLFDNKLIPGKIHHNSNQIHIEFHRAYRINETVKILCTQHPSHFRWIETTTGEVLNMKKNYTLFRGGYEKGVETYIGRVNSFGELTVGKIICWSYCISLSTIEKGRFYLHDKFEILTYSPESKETETPHKRNLKIKTLSPLWYVFLVAGTGILMAVVIILVRHCK